MTSSLELKNRIANKEWQLPQGVHWSDVYIEPFRNCYPGWASTPIGDKPLGVKMCVRIRDSDGSDPRHLDMRRQREYYEKHGLNGDSNHLYNGYHKYQSRMYTVDPETAGKPIRTLAHGLCMRNPPHEERNMTRDLIKQEITYNATGINPVITPAGVNEVGKPIYGGGIYKEYGLSIVRKPPTPFDVSRLEQPSKLYQKFHT